MTYRELICELSELTSDQLDCDVTIEDYAGEYYRAGLWIADTDVLDARHPVITIL